MAFIENLLTILAPSTGDPLGRIVIRYMDRNTFVYTIFNIYILLESPPPLPVLSSTLTDWLTELTPLLSLSHWLTVWVPLSSCSYMYYWRYVSSPLAFNELSSVPIRGDSCHTERKGEKDTYNAVNPISHGHMQSYSTQKCVQRGTDGGF